MAAASDVDSGTSSYYRYLPADDDSSQVQLISGAAAAGYYDHGPAEASAFDVSHYMAALDELMEESSGGAADVVAGGLIISPTPSTVIREEENMKRMKVKVGERIGFRTKSDVDVLDDGFKWRKYGKKSVKSSPNPRNYYRCTSVGCGVRKRVERDHNDARYVITTYEGVHNHIRPDGGSASYKNYRSSSSSSSNGAITAQLQAKPQPHHDGSILSIPDAWSLIMMQTSATANLLA